MYDQALISRFEWLRARPTDELATLPVYMVFDVLALGGRDLRGEPLKERRRILERLVGGHGMIFPVQRLARNGFKAWEEAVTRGYEGVVAKDPESRYVPGRTLKWLKVKQKDYRKEERGVRRPPSSFGPQRHRVGPADHPVRAEGHPVPPGGFNRLFANSVGRTGPAAHVPLAARAIIVPMPAPTNERQALERERAELPGQIAAYQRELDATPVQNRGRREMREWQIRRAQKRLAEIEARLAAIGAER